MVYKVLAAAILIVASHAAPAQLLQTQDSGLSDIDGRLLAAEAKADRLLARSDPELQPEREAKEEEDEIHLPEAVKGDVDEAEGASAMSVGEQASRSGCKWAKRTQYHSKTHSSDAIIKQYVCIYSKDYCYWWPGTPATGLYARWDCRCK